MFTIILWILIPITNLMRPISPIYSSRNTDSSKSLVCYEASSSSWLLIAFTILFLQQTFGSYSQLDTFIPSDAPRTNKLNFKYIIMMFQRLKWKKLFHCQKLLWTISFLSTIFKILLWLFFNRSTIWVSSSKNQKSWNQMT